MEIPQLNSYKEPASSIELTNRQQQTYDILREASSSQEPFHQWYLTALLLMDGKPMDYLSLASHSLREITDRLPSSLGIEFPSSPLDKVKGILPQIGKIRKKTYRDGWSGEISEPLRKLLGELELLQSDVEGPGRQGRLLAAMERRDPNSDRLSPVLRKRRKESFVGVAKFFQDVAHHNFTPSDEDFSKNLQTFEHHLISYFTPVTVEQQSLIEQIIRESPSPEKEEKLDELLLHNAANLGFLLQSLTNPEWLGFLVEHELFRNPGKARTGANGTLYFSADPALACLARLSPAAPRQVLEILERLPKSENPLVSNQIMRCILGFDDAALVQHSLKVIGKLMQSDLDGDWIHTKEIALKWLAWNEDQAVMSLMTAYFSSVIKHSDGRDGNRSVWHSQEIDREVLEKLGEMKPPMLVKALGTVLSKWFLREWEKFPDDHSYWIGGTEGSVAPGWRLSQEDLLDWMESGTRFDYQPSIWKILARRIEATAKLGIEKEGASGLGTIDATLRRNSCVLLDRLRWQFYAEYPSLSLAYARADVLQRIPNLGSHDHLHPEAFEKMLSAMAAEHGHDFLSEGEVNEFAAAVYGGPYDEKGPWEPSDYVAGFHSSQLYPIHTLLRGDALIRYQEVSEGRAPSSKRSASEDEREDAVWIEKAAPPEAGQFPSMSLDEIWPMLNEWTPEGLGDWRKRAKVSQLGKQFVRYVSEAPGRFIPASKWWENITNPEILAQLLSRGTDHHGAAEGAPVPSPDDWQTWLGVAGWILHQKRTAAAEKVIHWDMAAGSGAQFLASMDEASPSGDEAERCKLFEFLRDLAASSDARLEQRVEPTSGDWLTTAITSTKGRALEAMAKVARRLMDQGLVSREEFLGIYREIFTDEATSPAIFALVGGRLGHLLDLPVRATEEELHFLFPEGRPQHRDALLEGRLRHLRPSRQLFLQLPGLVSLELELMERRTANGDGSSVKPLKDLGLELASLFMIGHWSGEQEPQAHLTRFFRCAPDDLRAATVSHFARIVKENANVDPQLARDFWSSRFEAIKSATSLDVHRGELNVFLDWLACDKLPEGWRIDRAIEVAKTIDFFPTLRRSVENLASLAENPANLEGVMCLLEAIISKCQENLHWVLDDRVMKPLLAAGLKASDNQATVKAAKGLQERLLRSGLSQYRDP